MIRTVIWCPSKDGHLRYAHHLADAVAAEEGDTEGTESAEPARQPAIAIGILTTCPVGPLYQQIRYPMPCVGQQIRPREAFATPLHWVVDRIGYRLRLERLLIRWLREHPDCRTVHLQEAHLLTGPLTAWTIGRSLGRRLVYTMHNVKPHRQRNPLLGWIQRQWTRVFLRRMDALIVHSQTLKTELAQRYAIDAQRIHVVPHGVWAIEGAAAAPGVAAPGVAAPARNRLLCYGVIRRNKGLHHLLDALALPQAPADLTLTIAGHIDEPDYFKAELKPRLDALLAAGRPVTFREGYVPEADVPALFAAADLLVLPYDGFHAQSGVLFDAITYRRALVVTPSGALGDTVRELGIGAVARSPAPADLLEALSRGLALDPAEIAAACLRATQEHSWSHAARRTIEVYRSV